MKIIGSLTSPFARVVHAVCEELSLPYELETTTAFTKLTPEKETLINAHNPLMKVPILVDGDITLIDSQVIVRYLLRQYGVPSGLRESLSCSPEEENILTVIYGIMDAGVLWYMLRATHPGITGGFIDRSQKRLRLGLEWLARQKGLGERFGLGELALVCALEWFRKRSVYPWEGIDAMAGIHAAYADKACLVKTRIPDSL